MPFYLVKGVKIFKAKKRAFIALLTSLVITAGYFFIMIKFADILSYEIIVGFLKPMGAFGICSIVLSFFFLFFSQDIFTRFLKNIASWYLAILCFLTINTSVYSSSIMSLDRSVVVLYGMVVLGFIAVIYALLMRKKV